MRKFIVNVIVLARSTIEPKKNLQVKKIHFKEYIYEAFLQIDH